MRLWFPDLPGCFSPGDTVDEALLDASEALSLYAASLAKDGRALPALRTVSEIADDPNVVQDLRDHVTALVESDIAAAHAAE